MDENPSLQLFPLAKHRGQVVAFPPGSRKDQDLDSPGGSEFGEKCSQIGYRPQRSNLSIDWSRVLVLHGNDRPTRPKKSPYLSACRDGC
jgi:hypothetical protein